MKAKKGKPPVVGVCACGMEWPSKYALKKHRVYCSGVKREG